MAKWNVQLQRRLWVYSTVQVEAESEEAANDAAMAQAMELPPQEWDSPSYRDCQEDDIEILESTLEARP